MVSLGLRRDQRLSGRGRVISALMTNFWLTLLRDVPTTDILRCYGFSADPFLALTANILF